MARRRKERTYPELTGPRARARLVVPAGVVGGRWSEETRVFLGKLARAKARSVPLILRGRGRTGVAIAMGFHLGMQCSHGVRCITIGPQVWGWRGW